MTRMITDAEILAHRLEKVRGTVYETMTDKRWLAVRDASSVRSFGGIVNLRPHMLLMVAIFDDGQNLLDHWPVIERERRIPWDVHAGEMDPSSWGMIGAMMSSRFYSTKTGGFDNVEMGLTGTRWLPVEEDAIPGFGILSIEGTLAAAGLVGGVDPEIDHPTTEFGVSPKDITLRAHEVREIDLVADGRAEFPVQYELATTEISWITLSEFGTLTLSPGTVAGLFLQEIIATDALGVTVIFSIKVAVQ